MTKVYSLKNGKSYTAPSLFVNPQTNDDVKSLWAIDGLNKLNNIDGIYIALSDYKQLSPKLGFSQQPLFNENRMTLRDKIFLIDPSLDKLLTGMDIIKQKQLILKLSSTSKLMPSKQTQDNCHSFSRILF